MTPSPRRVAVYARVSTTEQTTESQLLELRLDCCGREGARRRVREEAIGEPGHPVNASFYEASRCQAPLWSPTLRTSCRRSNP